MSKVYIGVEQSQNGVLAGKNGRIVTTGNVKRKEISANYEQYIEVENGSDLYLTIDVNIQKVVEKYLKEGVEKHNAQGGSVILMDPKA